jgi:TonB family protein
MNRSFKKYLQAKTLIVLIFITSSICWAQKKAEKQPLPSGNSRGSSPTCSTRKPTSPCYFDNKVYYYNHFSEFHPEYYMARRKFIAAKYTPEALFEEIEGKVLLELLVDENGKVIKTRIIKSPGFGLGHSAQIAAKQWLYSHTTELNSPTIRTVKVRFDFRLAGDGR